MPGHFVLNVHDDDGDDSVMISAGSISLLPGDFVNCKFDTCRKILMFHLKASGIDTK